METGNHVLDGVQNPDPPWEGQFFEGEKGRPIVEYMDTLRSSVQKQLNRSRCRSGCGFRWNHKLDGGPDPSWEGAIFLGNELPL